MNLNLNVPKGTRHGRMIVKISKYLYETGPRNSRQILEYLNDTTRHGSTMHEMGNVLSKNIKWFQNVGSQSVGATLSGNYHIIVWDLSIWQKKENEKGDEGDE